MSPEYPRSPGTPENDEETHHFSFDLDNHNLNGEDIAVKSSQQISVAVNIWAAEVLIVYGYNFINYKKVDPTYCIGLLARNACEYSTDHAGAIDLTVKDDLITAIISNSGDFEDPLLAVMKSTSGGMSEVIKYADELEIETLGKKFEKRGKKLVFAGESDFNTGTRITFKKHIAKK